MSKIIILNSYVNPIVEICVLCTLPALYRAIISIKAYNPELAKEIIKEMDLPVCEEHAEKMHFEIEKRIVVPSRLILI